MDAVVGANALLAALGTALVLLSSSGSARAQAPVRPELSDASTIAMAAFEAGAPLPGWADLSQDASADPAGTPFDAVVRVADTQVHVGPPKTVLIRRVMHVRDAQSLAQVGHVQTDFQPAFEKLRLHRLQILRGESVIDHTRSATVRFLQRERELEFGVYTGVATASLLVPDLRMGDTLHVVLSISGTHPVLGPRLTQRVQWEADYPIAWRRVTLVEPVTRAETPSVRWQWMGGSGAPGPEPVIDVGPDGVRRLRFEGRQLSAVVPETDLPAEVEPARWLQFSAYESWDDVARWAGLLFPDDVPLPDEAQALVARLHALDDRDAQVSRALQWVQEEIRNWSMAFGEGSHRPRPPAEVLRLRYGDCKDKSWLLTRLLQALGFEAQPVLVSAATLRGPAAWLPSPEAFDHAVVRARLGGRDHYLDPTRRGQAGRLARMGQVFEGAAVLPVGPGREGLVTVRSPQHPDIATQLLSERFRIDRCDGIVSLEAELRWTGVEAEVMRVAARRVEPAQWRHVLLSDYAPRYPGLSLVGEPELLDDPVDNVLRLRGRFELPQPVVEMGGGAWGLQVSPANFRGSVALPTGTPRRFPLAVPAYPNRKRYDVEVVWPAGVSSSREPRTEHLLTPHFAFESTTGFRGRVQQWSLSFNALVPAVPPAEVPRFVQDVRELVSRLGGLLVVRRDDGSGACSDEPGSAIEPSR